MFKRTESDHDWRHVTSTGYCWKAFHDSKFLVRLLSSPQYVAPFSLNDNCPAATQKVTSLSCTGGFFQIFVPLIIWKHWICWIVKNGWTDEQFIRDFDASISDVSSRRIRGQCSRKCARKTLSQWINEITRWYANCLRLFQGYSGKPNSIRIYLRETKIWYMEREIRLSDPRLTFECLRSLRH